MDYNNNIVTLIGKMVSKRNFSHSVNYENFYEFDLEVTKLNGGIEVFPIIASERVIHSGFSVGNVVKVQGKFQTEKSYITDKTKFIIHADDINLYIAEINSLEANVVELEGAICRKPNYKVSHFGKGHCDALLAVKKNEEDTDFIPCIAFGATAKIFQKLKVGQQVKIEGRIKAKPHEKKLDPTYTQLTKTYEVLVTNIKADGIDNNTVLEEVEESLNNHNTILDKSNPNDTDSTPITKSDENIFKTTVSSEIQSTSKIEVKNEVASQVSSTLYTGSNLYQNQSTAINENKEEIKPQTSDSLFSNTKLNVAANINSNNSSQTNLYSNNQKNEHKKEPAFSYNYATINSSANKENKTEKEKMLAGELYDANHDQQLIAERQKIQELCYEYNTLKPSNMFWRKEHMKKILGKTKGEFFVEQPFMCDYGYNIEIGENFYSNHNLTILDANWVKFGDNVFVGPNCAFYTAEHPIDYKERNKGLEYAKPIIIGNNVWIGGNVVVLSGVKIGDNVVIGAGSVVTNDIPSNSVAVGNPCKVMRKIEE